VRAAILLALACAGPAYAYDYNLHGKLHGVEVDGRLSADEKAQTWTMSFWSPDRAKVHVKFELSGNYLYSDKGDWIGDTEYAHAVMVLRPQKNGDLKQVGTNVDLTLDRIERVK
jgi:hypothetical protein